MSVAGDGLALHVDASALAGLARAWAAAPELVAEEMGLAVREASLLLEREVRERTPVGVGGGGGLAGSIGARDPEVVPGEGGVGVVGTALRYAVPVELGRRPGGRQPPVQALADWAQARLGVSAEESRGVAWAIARRIALEGTEGAHMFRAGTRAVAGAVEGILARGLDRVTRRLAEAGT